MKKIVQQIELHVLRTNFVVEVMEIACQWKNIAMELNIALMEVMKICADLRQTLAQFQITIAKLNRDSFHAMTLVFRL